MKCTSNEKELQVQDTKIMDISQLFSIELARYALLIYSTPRLLPHPLSSPVGRYYSIPRRLPRAS